MSGAVVVYMLLWCGVVFGLWWCVVVREGWFLVWCRNGDTYRWYLVCNSWLVAKIYQYILCIPTHHPIFISTNDDEVGRRQIMMKHTCVMNLVQ